MVCLPFYGVMPLHFNTRAGNFGLLSRLALPKYNFITPPVFQICVSTVRTYPRGRLCWVSPIRPFKKHRPGTRRARRQLISSSDRLDRVRRGWLCYGWSAKKVALPPRGFQSAFPTRNVKFLRVQVEAFWRSQAQDTREKKIQTASALVRDIFLVIFRKETRAEELHTAHFLDAVTLKPPLYSL